MSHNSANEKKHITLYHSTTPEDAERILREGYRDATTSLSTYTGVRFADKPLDQNDGALGNTVLSITVDPDLVAAYEWIEEEKPYHEFLIPASLVNSVRTQLDPIVND